MYKIHWFSFKKILQMKTIKSKWITYLKLLLWPLFSIIYCLIYARRFHKLIDSHYHINAKTLFIQSMHLSLFGNVRPLDYYRYHLYLHTYKPNDLICGYEAAVLLKNINHAPDLDAVDDKAIFYSICKMNGLSIPAIYSIIENKNSSVNLPCEDLIIKPARGSKGTGIELWEYTNGKYHYETLMLGPDELKEHIQEKFSALHLPIIIQQRITNHNGLAELSTGGLITVRVVTVRTAENQILHLMSVLIIPVGKKLLRHKVILSPINEETGELGAATTYGVIPRTFDKHPDTNLAFVGLQIPYWKEILSLTKEAHTHFMDFASLGWDIAITESGPVIIEANKIWDVETMQNPHQIPLGKTKFIDICCNMIVQKIVRRG